MKTIRAYRTSWKLFDALAALGLIEVLFTSVMLVSWVESVEKHVDVCRYIIGILVVVLTIIPSSLYVGDAIGLGVGGGSLALLSFFPLVATVAMTRYHQTGSLVRFVSSHLDFSRLPGLMVVSVVGAIVGFGPMLPTFYPTSIGDTAHHYSYVEYLYRYSHLPHSAADFYPLVHHGLYHYSGWNYPQGMHILIVLVAKATGVPVIQMLGSAAVFAGILTFVAVYVIATEFGSSKLAVLAATASLLGSFGLATRTGSMTTVWGLLFVTMSLLFMQAFEKRPIMRKIPLVMVSTLGLAVYYSFYAPLVLMALILTLFLVGRWRQAIAATFMMISTMVAGLALYAILQVHSVAGDIGYFAIAAYFFFSWIPELFLSMLSDPATTAFIIVVCVVIFLLVTRTLSGQSKLRAVLTASTFCCAILALRPYLAVIFYSPSVVSCLTSCLYFWVPGYNFGLSFGLALFIAITCMLLCRVERSVAILVTVLVTFAFVYAYFLTGNLYYESKYVFVASTLLPVLMVSVIQRARGSVGPFRMSTVRSMMANPAFRIPRIRKASFSRFSQKALGLFLLGLIAVNLALQGYVVVSQQIALRPVVYSGELEAGEWLRANADQIFPCKNYEYFLTMDNLRGDFFEAASEHQFNMNHLPAGWSLPPFPLSYTYAEWLSFAKPGDILVGDESYPNAIPDDLASLPMGVPIAAHYGYIEILYVNHPIIVVQYLGQSLFEAEEHKYACTIGWSTTPP